MPPTAPRPSPPSSADSPPRVIIYHQTHYRPDGTLISCLPLLHEGSGVTHIILAAIHLNDSPGDVTLNDDGWQSARASQVWAEGRLLQAGGIRVLAMLGGAAKGTYSRLDGPQFEEFYAPLRHLLVTTGVDGVDLDVEEEMSLAGIVRLIDRLRADMGPEFLITMAPVATALLGQKQLSGFNYFELDKAMGRHVAWYNTQFYCGWGSAETTEHYDLIVACGWPADKVVMGLVTNPANGEGFVFEDLLMATLAVLRDQYPGFGGVMGWEYFNAASSLEGGGDEGRGDRPWLWCKGMSSLLRSEIGPAEGECGGKKLTEEELGRSDNPFLQIIGSAAANKREEGRK